MRVGSLYRLVALRVHRARALLHVSDPDVTLGRQRAAYALLTACTGSAGEALCRSLSGGSRLVHATPGHCTLLCAATVPVPLLSDLAAAATAWFADRGIGFSARFADEPVRLEPAGRADFVRAWLEVQGGPPPGGEARGSFAVSTTSPLHDLAGLMEAGPGPGGDAVAADLRARWLALLRPLAETGASAWLLSSPVARLTATSLPGGLAYLRMDVAGFRVALIEAAGSGAELTERGAGLAAWFRDAVPRLAVAASANATSLARPALLLSVCDDLVAAGSRPVLAAFARAVAHAYAGAWGGRMRWAMVQGAPGAGLADLARDALARLGGLGETAGASLDG